MTDILFMCAGNDARSPMAEGFARARLRGNHARVFSAGLTAAPLHPLAVRVMAEVGIEINGHEPRTLATLRPEHLDIVIDVGDALHPPVLLPGRPEWVSWLVPDPGALTGEDEAVLRVFRETRDRIRGLVDDFFDKGYFCAFVGARRHHQAILDSMGEAVLVVDVDGRVVDLNRAAQRLTEYAARDLLNQRVDLVLPSRAWEGGVVEAKSPGGGLIRVEILTRSGTRRPVSLRATRILSGDDEPMGTLLALDDPHPGQTLKQQVDGASRFSGIIGRDPKMRDVFDMIRELADAHVPVLIQGESGTGKELVAAAIHNEGARAAGHFVPVNCGALPESLLESELFGHVKGAFTGAIRDKKGRFELADGGTIFLDEVGEISTAMQVKLLRVIQEGTFERVGGEETLKVDVRIISATNRDLAAEVQVGRFRDDLFYRLCVVPLYLPALRERPADIPLLADALLKQIAQGAGRTNLRLSPAALSRIQAHPWPGNVRELQNWLQYALVKCRGDEILPEHLPVARSAVAAVPPPVLSRRRVLTREVVQAAILESHGNKQEAARRLHISRATLYRFLEAAGAGAPADVGLPGRGYNGSPDGAQP